MMQRVNFSATAKAQLVDKGALKKAIDLGQQVIGPLKVEEFSSALLRLENDDVEIEFSIVTDPDPEPEPIDPEELSAEVEGAE